MTEEAEVTLASPALPEKGKRRGKRRDYSRVRTSRKKEVFLKAVERTGSITKACRVVWPDKPASVVRQNHYTWQRKDRAYAEAFDHAVNAYLDDMEAECDRRGLRGVRRPIYQGGRLVGYQVEYSDTLLMFRLNGERAKKYRQRVEHVGEGGGPIEVADLSRLTLPELRVLRAIRTKLEGGQPSEEDLEALRVLAGTLASSPAVARAPASDGSSSVLALSP